MQMLKCLNLFVSQCTYHNYLNLMGTLQQGNGLRILAILVIVFLDLNIILCYEKFIIMNSIITGKWKFYDGH